MRLPKKRDDLFNLTEKVLFFFKFGPSARKATKNPIFLAEEKLLVKISQFAIARFNVEAVVFTERKAHAIWFAFDNGNRDGLIGNPEGVIVLVKNQFAFVSVKLKVDPSPSSLSTQIFSLWASMKCLQIARPSPVPPLLRERLLSTR